MSPKIKVYLLITQLRDLSLTFMYTIVFILLIIKSNFFILGGCRDTERLLFIETTSKTSLIAIPIVSPRFSRSIVSTPRFPTVGIASKTAPTAATTASKTTTTTSETAATTFKTAIPIATVAPTSASVTSTILIAIIAPTITSIATAASKTATSPIASPPTTFTSPKST